MTTSDNDDIDAVDAPGVERPAAGGGLAPMPAAGNAIISASPAMIDRLERNMVGHNGGPALDESSPNPEVAEAGAATIFRPFLLPQTALGQGCWSALRRT